MLVDLWFCFITCVFSQVLWGVVDNSLWFTDDKWLQPQRLVSVSDCPHLLWCSCPNCRFRCSYSLRKEMIVDIYDTSTVILVYKLQTIDVYITQPFPFCICICICYLGMHSIFTLQAIYINVLNKFMGKLRVLGQITRHQFRTCIKLLFMLV